MECVRCHKSMNTDTAEMNAYHYGSNWYACPHCGKLYKVYRILGTPYFITAPIISYAQNVLNFNK